MKKQIIAVIASILFLGAAIGLTLWSIRGEIYISIPFIWIMLLAGWAETINAFVNK